MLDSEAFCAGEVWHIGPGEQIAHVGETCMSDYKKSCGDYFAGALIARVPFNG